MAPSPPSALRSFPNSASPSGEAALRAMGHGGLPLTSLRFQLAQALLYNLAVCLLQRYMRRRQQKYALLRPDDPAPFRFDVRRIAKWHNLALAAYSLLAAVAIVVEQYGAGRFASHDAFHCHPPRTLAYGYLWYSFYLSKIWEGVDTVLLVLSNKPVILLHRIHHSTTFSTTGGIFYGSAGYDVLPIVENLIVHFFMYTYYAFPRKLRSLRPVMTSGQIIQFLFVLSYAAYHIHNKGLCDDERWVLYYNTFCYLLYLVLFANFFYQQYIGKAKAAKAKADAEAKNK